MNHQKHHSMAARALFATPFAILFAAGVALSAAPAAAEKPNWAGGGKHEHKHKADNGAKDHPRHDRPGQRSDDARGSHAAKRGGRDIRVGAYFDGGDREAARRYYAQQYGSSARKCPPGLAKKNNGCMPPGQARKYAVGKPLPAGVVYYPVAQPVLVHLPPAPAGHKYVRVAADILLIAVGSSMVVDAISDLMSL